MTIRKHLLMMSILISLVGCSKQHSYSYLVQHPAELKQAVDACQAATEPTPDQTSQCKVVMSAATDFMTLSSEEEQDPEKFGQQVLDAEEQCTHTQDDMLTAQQKLVDLQNKQAAGAEIQQTRAAVAKLTADYHQQHENIKRMLAVIGANSSPE